MEDNDNSSYKSILLETKRNLKIVLWFYTNISIELRRYINQYDSSIQDAIIDFKHNGRTTMRMHQLYGFATYQNPSVLGIFGLKSLPVWNINSISNLLESNISSITNEFLILQQRSLYYERLKTSSTSERNENSFDSWKVYHIMEEGLRNTTNLFFCPAVSKVLDNLNICDCSLGYAYFSVLSANASIEPHYGVTNTKLRIQIPLLNQSNINKCSITIDNKEYQYKEGKAFIFDDSYLHSVRNDSDQDRVVLLIDIWHPDLSKHEIKVLSEYFYNGCGFTQNDLSHNKPDHFYDNKTISRPNANQNTCIVDYDYIIKILMVGLTGVGKTSMVMRYVEDYYTDSFMATMGVDFKIKRVKIRDKDVKLQIWDTAGPERFRSINSSYYRGAHIIFVLVDLSDPDNNTEFEKETDFYFDEIYKHASEYVTIMLIGTKSDLIQKRSISYDRIISYAENKKVLYYETSSKENINIQEAFITAVRFKLKQIIVNSEMKKVVTKNKICSTS